MRQGKRRRAKTTLTGGQRSPPLSAPGPRPLPPRDYLVTGACVNAGESNRGAKTGHRETAEKSNLCLM
jgi:hypothetical protein